MESFFNTAYRLTTDNVLSRVICAGISPIFRAGGSSQKISSGVCSHSSSAWTDMCESGRTAVRLAGLSGALAVGLGAYGAHVLQPSVQPELAQIFEKANRYHMIHTLALMGSYVSRRRAVTAALFFSGIVLFSGSAYVYVLTDRKTSRSLMPYGGMLFIAGWLSLVL